MKLLIEKDAAEKIVQYLASRPYAEVYKLVASLMNLPEGQPLTVKPEVVPSQDSASNG